MLQHNLGLAYFNQSQDYVSEFKCRRYLQLAIKCFYDLLEIYVQDDFPEKWEINQQDLEKTQQLIGSF
jgi:uncharacterized protein YutE (UPF0331/DUF86 family)